MLLLFHLGIYDLFLIFTLGRWRCSVIRSDTNYVNSLKFTVETFLKYLLNLFQSISIINELCFVVRCSMFFVNIKFWQCRILILKKVREKLQVINSNANFFLFLDAVFSPWGIWRIPTVSPAMVSPRIHFFSLYLGSQLKMGTLSLNRWRQARFEHLHLPASFSRSRKLPLAFSSEP